MIEKTPQVKKTLQALSELDESNLENSNRGGKEKYTVKKNRISAQLSRDRRSAIVQSLMELCVQNIEKRKHMEQELEEAKDILKRTLCDGCKGNLKQRVKLPQNRSKQQKKHSGISIRGKGGNAFIMSILALSVALVSVYSPDSSSKAPIIVPTSE